MVGNEWGGRSPGFFWLRFLIGWQYGMLSAHVFGRFPVVDVGSVASDAGLRGFTSPRVGSFLG